MKFVIQRCQEASVSVDGKTVGAIEKGLMVLIGVGKDDTCLLYTSDAADE